MEGTYGSSWFFSIQFDLIRRSPTRAYNTVYLNTVSGAPFYVAYMGPLISILDR